LLGFTLVLWYCMRRVSCCTCGVTVEKVPWATGKQRACIAYCRRPSKSAGSWPRALALVEMT